MDIRNLKDWSKQINRADRPLKVGDSVCSEHFHPQDILYYHPDIEVNGIIIKGEKRGSPILIEGAIPKIFKGYPSYMTSNKSSKRKSPKERATPIKKQKVAKLMVSVSIADCISSHVESPHPNNNLELDLTKDAIQENEPSSPHLLDLETEIDIAQVQLPDKAWAKHDVCDEILFVKIASNHKVSHCVAFTKGHKIEVEIGGVHVHHMSQKVSTAQAIMDIINAADQSKACEGTELGSHSKNCKGMCSKKALRCKSCLEGNKNLMKKQKRLLKLVENQKKRRQQNFRIKKSREIWRKKVKTMRTEIKLLLKKISEINKAKVMDLIRHLPQQQQQIVEAFLNASKCKGPQGMRFKVEWVYECLLMRIKSAALYKHLRFNKILPLPSKETLNRYLKHLRPAYGFQSSLFEVLKHKVAEWSESERHGALLIDEVKLAPGVTFNKATLEVAGFVDLGQHTPHNLKDEMGDHALVLLYQPFRGLWVQSVGCFLAKSNVKADVLTKLILEGINLLESSGLHVDAVVSDAAGWNRSMWERFGIAKTSCSSVHPTSDDPQRRLWFFSDWCHLIKCMRNALCPLPPRKKNTDPESDKDGKTSMKELCTPDGTVKRQHWVGLFNEEEKRRSTPSQLQYCPSMERKVVFPTGFQRMNVAAAFHFFSNSYAAGMEWYRKKGVEALKDSEPTETLIRKIDLLADAMNSNGPRGALWPNSTQEKAIIEYEQYHEQCMDLVKSNGKKCFWTEQTDLGLTVTIRSTLELSQYLRDIVGYQYVMTARFNQDALEQFFANIRRAAGPNSHPDPTLFAQLYRLLSAYSLVKPPKGSNVTGVENMKALINAQDVVGGVYEARREELDILMDEVLTNGEALDALPLSCDLDHSYGTPSAEVDEPITRFMAGFTGKKKKALVENCDACFGTLEKPHSEANSGDAFILTKEMYHLTLPSDELAYFVREMERAVFQCLEIHGVHKEMIFTALKYMKVDPSLTIGCLEHSESLKKKIMKFYIVMRMFFAADRKNTEIDRENELRKGFSKRSKL